MSDRAEPTDEELDAIRALCRGNVSYRKDGWRQLILMQNLRFTAAGQAQEMDALLCLNHENPTYPTKLYLSRNVGCGLNWNEEAYILGRNWYTFSWANVSPTLTPLEILADHIAPLAVGIAA